MLAIAGAFNVKDETIPHGLHAQEMKLILFLTPSVFLCFSFLYVQRNVLEICILIHIDTFKTSFKICSVIP